MAFESIFHKLIKNENSYTQLLCNVLKRDEAFRGKFLTLMGVGRPESVKPPHIESQTRLGDCGQADIRISGPDLCMVIEVKTECFRPLEDSQQPDRLDRSYAAWLQANAKPGAVKKLAYLVPANWEHRDDLGKRIADLLQPPNDRSIIRLWEEVASLIPKQTDAAAFSIIDDFRLLLDERFGPTTFEKEEVERMYNQDFPIGIMLKLVKLIDELRFEFGAKKLDIQKDELGFYPKVGGAQKGIFYVGCWPPIWEQTKNPLCFGIYKADLAQRKAFAKELKLVYQQEPISEGDYQVGFIPNQDLERPDAASHISKRIRKIFSAIS
jgi:hypothetical protein